MLGMANAGPHTNGSQFYITLGDRSYLDGNYTLFGSVVEGMDVVNKIIQGDTIKSVTIVRIGSKTEEFRPNTESFLKMVEDAKTKLKASIEKKTKLEDEWIKKNIPGSSETKSGLKFFIRKKGNGKKPAEGTTVKIRYSGKVLIDQLSFVSSSEGGQPEFGKAPVEFEYTIGKTKINYGLDDIISEMNYGEKRIAVVPADLAYGNSGFYGKSIQNQKRFVISPNSTLYYEVEILE